MLGPVREAVSCVSTCGLAVTQSYIFWWFCLGELGELVLKPGLALVAMWMT